MASDSDFELAKIRFRALHKKAKELHIRDEDIAKFPFVQKHPEKKLNIVTYILKVLFCGVLLLGFSCLAIFLAVKGGLLSGKTVATWTTIYTGININKDVCLVPFTEYFLDAFRPPVNCSICKGVTSFHRVTNLSQEEFVKSYAYSGQPLIVEDATKNWTASEVFSFEFFKNAYKPNSPVMDQSARECQFFPYQTNFISLREVFNMPKPRRDMRGKPWYIGWSNCDPEAANIFREHYSRPYFLSPEMESSRTDWIFMGTPGYGAHLHIDAVQQMSWQAQIRGDKEWILEPPPECYYDCVGFKDTVKEGEIIVLDTNKWFHKTNVVGDKLSIVIGSEYD